MRAFLAIELDEETRKFLCGIQKNFLTAGIKGNYSLEDNLHLTIKFLAEINAGQTEKLAVMMKNIALQHDAFEITIDSLGRFNKGNRMILWAGIRNNISLQNVYRAVDLNIGSIVPGLEEKRYSPHITLVREAQSPELLSRQIMPIKNISHTFKAAGLSLMESTRAEGRLAYVRRVFEPFKTE